VTIDGHSNYNNKQIKNGGIERKIKGEED